MCNRILDEYARLCPQIYTWQNETQNRFMPTQAKLFDNNAHGFAYSNEDV